MNKIGLIMLGVGGIAIIGLASSSKKASAAPTGPWSKIQGYPINYEDYIKLTAIERGGDIVEQQSGWLMNYFHAPTIQVALSQLPDEVIRLERQTFAVFAERRKLLPKDASPAQDKYTKQRWATPKFNTGTVDEFGRPAAGLPSNFGSTCLRVAQEIAPYIPVYGPAISAGISFMVAIGQGKSLKDASIAAARNYVYSQGGPAARIAFDVGVAAASGENVQDAAQESVISEMDKKYPGSRAAYNKGKEAYQKAKS